MILVRPALRIVVLNMYAEDAPVLDALAAGASAYVLKDSDPSEVLDAIRQVSRGNLVVDARARPALTDSIGQRRTDVIGHLSGCSRRSA